MSDQILVGDKSFEDEIGWSRGVDLAGGVLNVLQATGASCEAILEALDDALADLFASMDNGELPGFLETSFDSTSGADDSIRLIIHKHLFWENLTAAAHERLFISGHAPPFVLPPRAPHET